jgi:hypothetical protein
MGDNPGLARRERPMPSGFPSDSHPTARPVRAARRVAAPLALAAAVLAASGCAPTTSPGDVPAAPRSAVANAGAPLLPVRVAPDVVVTQARFGVLEVAEDGRERFVPTDAVPAVDGTTVGWVLEVRTERASLAWTERVQLPAAPADWGDAVDDPDVEIAADGRSVVARGEDAVEGGELRRFYWSLSAGDPAGEYRVDVALEGRPVASFRFRVPATVAERPILVRQGGATPWT